MYTTNAETCHNSAIIDTKIESNYRHLKAWFGSNRLCINKDKTQMLFLSLREQFRINEAIKLLVVYLDSTMSWKCHTSYLENKISKNIYLIRELSDITSEYNVVAAYFAHIYSHLNHAILVWRYSPHCKNHILENLK